MPIALTEEQQSFVEALRDFCRREAGTHEQRLGLAKPEEHGHSAAVYGKLAELGYLGACVPEEYGGSGGGAVDMCLLIEEVHRGLLPLAGMGVSLIVGGAYERFGSEEQKDDILRGIAEGTVECIAMSEPGAGSDVGSLTCRAERDDGHYVINGQKTWISAAHVAKHILLIARTDSGASKHEGLSMISVPTDAPGVEIRGIETMGGREVNDVYFTDCAVPAESLVGTPGDGWRQLMAGLNHERLIIAAQAIAMAQRSFADALQYVKERKQFGRPIGTFQSLAHRIADLATEIECCRLMIYDLARHVDANPGKTFPREASMAKLKSTELAKRVALEGMQMMGGYGYASEYEMEAHVRRALVMPIVGGTSEIQRQIIASTYGL